MNSTICITNEGLAMMRNDRKRPSRHDRTVRTVHVYTRYILRNEKFWTEGDTTESHWLTREVCFESIYLSQVCLWVNHSTRMNAHSEEG